GRIRGPRFTISLKRSTPNLQLSTSRRPITPSLAHFADSKSNISHYSKSETGRLYLSRRLGLSVRFDEHVATNFAYRLLNSIFRFVGGRLIEVRRRFVRFNRNADEKSFGCFAASEQGR